MATQLAANQIHVWLIPLASLEPGHPPDFGPLSPDEIQRAQRFHFERDRVRFIAARSALRTILAQYLHQPPRDLSFSYTPKGKPRLASGSLHFNLSHSRDFALLALTQHARVGADIEYINPDRATEDIAARFFSPAEIATLAALPLATRIEAFFQCWTRKEAYVKAVGAGLSIPLDSFDVAFCPNTPPSILQIRNSPETASHWRLHDILSPQGYAAAVAVEGEPHELIFQIWNY